MRDRLTRGLLAGLLALAVLTAPLAAVVYTRVTVATSATLIYTGASGGSTVLIRNAGAASVYLGDAAVLTSTGFELTAGSAVSLPVGPNDPVYGIVVTSTVIVHTLESRR
jgi:hypothetical protein